MNTKNFKDLKGCKVYVLVPNSAAPVKEVIVNAVNGTQAQYSLGGIVLSFSEAMYGKTVFDNQMDARNAMQMVKQIMQQR